VLSGENDFRAAAQKAVRRWRFAPATRDDVPIAFTLTKMVVFTQKPRP
jgi:TonB family protein